MIPIDPTEASLIDQARAQLTLDSAQGGYQSAIGSMIGTPRPPQAPYDDDLYRRICFAVNPGVPCTQPIAWHALLGAIFGTQAAIVAAGKRAWDWFVVNDNEVVLEIPDELIAYGPENAAYLHGFFGRCTATGAPTPTVTVPGNVFLATDDPTVLSVYIFYSGVWNTHSIAAASVAAGVTTLTVSPDVPVDVTGGSLFVDVPASGSFDGDTLAASALVAADGIDIPHDRRVYLAGEGLVDVVRFYVPYVLGAGTLLRVEYIPPRGYGHHGVV